MARSVGACACSRHATRCNSPSLLIAGGDEVEAGEVTVSERGVEEQTRVPFEAFLERAKALAASRALELS